MATCWTKVPKQQGAWHLANTGSSGPRFLIMDKWQVHITVQFVELLAYNGSVDPQVNDMLYPDGNRLKAWVKKWTEPDPIPVLMPSFPLLHYANSLSEGLQQQQRKSKRESPSFHRPPPLPPPKMYHHPGTHTQQMVDSEINSGLPDFLHHKNLTLLLPPVPHTHSGR